MHANGTEHDSPSEISVLARHLFTLGFGERDKARMHELAERNQAGDLSAAQK